MGAVIGTKPLLNQLSTGAGAPVLVADFQPLTAAPRLSELVAEAAAGNPVHQVDPRGALSGERLYAALPDLAAEAAATFRAAAAPGPVSVVGHCSAAALTLQIADRLSGDRDVAVVLVQPTWPGAAHVTERLADFQAKLSLPDLSCPDLDGDPWSAVAAMELVMSQGLADLATRLGLGKPPLAFSELLVSYRTWLAYLLACRNDRTGRAPAGAVAMTVLTEDPEFVVPGTDPGRYRIAVPPPTEHPDSVNPELAKFVLDLLGDE